MKLLFLIFHGFDESNGISKKIQYQIKALKACGLDVYTCFYDASSQGSCCWHIDNKILADYGKGTMAKIRKRIDYSPIIDFIKNQNFNFVYIRSYHNANPFTINLVKRLKKQGAKVIMEIPTYPYDNEYRTTSMKADLLVDKMFRHQLAKTLHAIVTFSDIDRIFGQRTIRISNGIDFDAIPIKQNINNCTKELHLIGVAEVHFWHGFDRIVNGLVNYYQHNPDYKVYFHIVGNLSGEIEESRILPPIKLHHLQPYIQLHGAMYGKELDNMFEQSDFGIGSLARHRSDITNIKTLKNREYAARGIPFIYSETDSDFDDKPYILKAPADETPIDIAQIVRFHNDLSMSPAQIRNSVQNLSWVCQMKKVIDITTKL